MSFLARFSILAKILTVVLAMSAISVAVSWLGIRALSLLNEEAATVNSAASRAQNAARANTNIIAMTQAEFSIALDPRPENRAEVRKIVDEELRLLNKRIDEASKTRDERVKAMMPAVKDAIAEYVHDMEGTFRLADGVKDVQLNEQTERLRTSALKSKAAAEKVRGMIRAVAERLNERADHFAKAANENYEVSSRWLISIAAIGVFFGLISGLIIGQFGIAKPIRALVKLLQRLAAGEEVEITGTERKDEVGETARAVTDIKLFLAKKAREEAEAKALQDLRAVERRKIEMKKLADDFEGAVGEIIETVTSASTELEASAGTLMSTADREQHLATTVAAASEQASTNVQSVASATDEIASSIANGAVEQARNTNDRVGELAKAASRIGDVVELINTIAGQTNLLALNATIEAARAGEAGRGFAVVAQEVKALAEQTGKATGEISQQITGMQAATQESVIAIKEIGTTIERMSEIASTIASAVEEQGAATQEISRNVQQAAQGTQQVSSSICDVQHGASETGSASSQVLSAAQSLARDSTRLKAEVNKFLNTVRAA